MKSQLKLKYKFSGQTVAYKLKIKAFDQQFVGFHLY